jgi:glycosyltransferase involved in cell wall biosynthesis
MKAKWDVGVVIPARNEEKLLPRCLESVLTAKASVERGASVSVVVVCDSSSDGTSRIAKKMLASQGIVLEVDAGVVGVARSVGSSHLLRRCNGPLSRCWIANTDADCIVPEDWLVKQVQLAERGIHAVAGVVRVDSFVEHGPEVVQRFQSSYVIRPDGSHPHVHGANLGCRADRYVQAGGWKPLKTAEDHDLWNRLATTGARRCSTSWLEVETSGRRVGRAPNGFAEALAAHNETAA